jgi:AraC family transcriptional regulator, regulatory protein of adaptative response / methylated-DNA-[protein]-cysteine methyltransferase
MTDPNWPELPIATTSGVFLATYSATGLTQLDFPESNPASRRAVAAKIPLAPARWHRLATRAVQAVVAGREVTELPPLDLTRGTEFQQQVWRALGKIPLGQTRSYGEIADTIGKPKAVRAVGGACGANPIPLLIPCHRVLAANRKIGGFSGGLDRKQSLLEREGVTWRA